MSPRQQARQELAVALERMRDGQRLTPCQVHPSVWWYGDAEDRATAVAFCATCPLQRLCRRAGLYEEFGVWGGIDREARRAVREEAA